MTRLSRASSNITHHTVQNVQECSSDGYLCARYMKLRGDSRLVS